jgi:hypothetical protein
MCYLIGVLRHRLDKADHSNYKYGRSNIARQEYKLIDELRLVDAAGTEIEHHSSGI